MPVQNTAENFAKCICNTCPTYNDCMQDGHEKLFCARGKSTCGITANGCVCGNCPVHLENNLTSYYYCMSGKTE